MSELVQPSDADLVIQTLENKEVFLTLMQRYERRLLAYIYRLSGASKEDAQDILQEAFLKVYLNLRGFDQKKSFSSWVYRITHNETMSHFRKRKARPSITLQTDEISRIADECDIDEVVDATLRKERIEKVLGGVDTKYRDVLVLKYLEEKSYDEMSAILRKPVGTVGTLLNRAKKKYKEAYDKRYL